MSGFIDPSQMFLNSYAATPLIDAAEYSDELRPDTEHAQGQHDQNNGIQHQYSNHDPDASDYAEDQSGDDDDDEDDDDANDAIENEFGNTNEVSHLPQRMANQTAHNYPYDPADVDMSNSTANAASAQAHASMLAQQQNQHMQQIQQIHRFRQQQAQQHALMMQQCSQDPRMMQAMYQQMPHPQQAHTPFGRMNFMQHPVAAQLPAHQHSDQQRPQVAQNQLHNYGTRQVTEAPNGYESVGKKRQIQQISNDDSSETEDELSPLAAISDQKKPKLQETVVPDALLSGPRHFDGMQYVTPQQLSMNATPLERSSSAIVTYPASAKDEAYCPENNDLMDPPKVPTPIVISSSDEEPKITKIIPKINKEDGRLVCIGRLGPCFAMTFRVPNPGSRPANLTHWPRFKVKIRDAQHNSGLYFILSDPTGVDFAKVDLSTARVISQLREKTQNKFTLDKLEIYLKRRPMHPGEEAGDAYPPGVKCHYPLDFIFNVPKALALFMTEYIQRFDLQLTHNGLRNTIIEEEPEHDQDIELWVPRAKNAVPASADEDIVERAALNMINSHSSTGLDSLKQSDLIVTPLLPHQEEGLFFMIEREKNPFTTAVEERFKLWRPEEKDDKPVYYNKALDEHVINPPDPSLGGILADDMGLGKTLSALALITATLPQAEAFALRRSTVLKAGQIRPNLKATLIIVPKTLLEANWQKQIDTHVVPGKLKVVLFYGPDRARDLKAFEKADIVITTYGVLEADSRIPYNRKGPLLPRASWFRIILDEAHSIRNPDTNRARACRAIEATRRWAITGTPIQNHIMDFGSLCIFLRVHPFDTKPRFQKYIELPFRQEKPIVLSRLRVLVDTMTLRRTKDNLGLPDKDDGTISIEMSDKERQLYDALAENTFKQIKAMTHNRTKMAAGTMGHFLKKLGILRQFCAHKQDMLSQEDLKLLKGFTADSPIEIEDEEESEVKIKEALDMLAILQECDQDTCIECREKIQLPCEVIADETSDTPPPDEAICYVSACYHLICPKCRDKFMKEQERSRVPFDNRQYACKICDRVVRLTLYELSHVAVQNFFRRREELRAKPRLAKQLGTYTGPSSKVLYLLSNCQNFKAWNAAHPEEPPMKAVVFTYWTTHLDLIEIALEDHNVKYARLDGRMGHRQRLDSINRFEQDNETIIFLVSIGAGGVGLNLVAANVVFIMEPQWNPQAEQQAVDRVHRIGQKRNVRVARLIAQDSIEEKIQEIGKRKLELARVTLTKKLGRKEEREQKMKELQGLFARKR